MDGEVGADGLVRLLAEPARRKVFAALVLGARTPAQIGAATELRTKDVMVALRKLADGGLVMLTSNGAIPNEELFDDVARRSVVARPQEDLGYTDERVTSVLRAFVRDGRLLGLPAGRSKRTTVLSHVAQSFEPGVDYSEAEVDAVLRTWAAGDRVDHITLRRYLVDEDLLRRANGIYRRSGGWTDVSA